MLERLRFWIEDHISVKMGFFGIFGLLVLAFWLGGQFSSWSHRNQLLLVSEPAEDPKLHVLGQSSALGQNQAKDPDDIKVHVAGAVDRPGVYDLESDDRVQDALDVAGLSADADANQLNLAQPIRDGEKIIVPRQGEVAANPSSPTSVQGVAPRTDGRVSINHGDQAALMTLPSVGEVRAKAIIAYREDQGGFHSLEDLKQVPGIGDKTYAQLEPHICL